jgi:hypothetical protein
MIGFDVRSGAHSGQNIVDLNPKSRGSEVSEALDQNISETGPCENQIRPLRAKQANTPVSVLADSQDAKTLMRFGDGRRSSVFR